MELLKIAKVPIKLNLPVQEEGTIEGDIEDEVFRFAYENNITHGEEKVPTLMIYAKYKDWKKTHRLNEAQFFEKFGTIFKSTRDHGFTYYLVNEAPFVEYIYHFLEEQERIKQQERKRAEEKKWREAKRKRIDNAVKQVKKEKALKKRKKAKDIEKSDSNASTEETVHATSEEGNS